VKQPLHVIFGAGLIGGYLAGHFSSSGLRTAVIGRANKLAGFKRGLKITDFLGNTAHASEVPEYQTGEIKVLYITIKCTGVAASIPDLKNIIQTDTIIICCQNGFGGDQAIRNAFPDNTILSAVVGFNVAEKKIGHLHRSTDGKFVVEHHSWLAEELEQIDCAALPISSTKNILAERWAKLQLNLANPVNALANVPVKPMTEDAGYRKIIADLMQEMFLVTDELGIKLPKITAVPAKALPKVMRLPNWLFLRLAQKMLAIDPTARTSMWWDLNQSRKTEIAYINGAVVEEAERLGLSCPLNSRLIKLIDMVENGDAKIGHSAASLTKLLAHD